MSIKHKTSPRDRGRNQGKRRHLRSWRDGEVRLHPVMQSHRVPLRHLQPGTVVRASVDYGDGTGRKVRPVVIVRAGTHDVVVMTVTSQVWRSGQPMYDAIDDWHGAGLAKPSVVRMRPITLPRIDLHEVLGSLRGADMALVRRTKESLLESTGTA